MNFNNQNQETGFNPNNNPNANPNANFQQAYNPNDMFNNDVHRQMQMNMPQFPQMNFPQFHNPMMPGFPQMHMQQMGIPNSNFPQQQHYPMGLQHNTIPNMGFPQTLFNPIGFPQMNIPQMDLNQVSGQPGTSYSYSSFSSSSATTKDGQTSYASESKSSTLKDDGTGNAPHKEVYENKTAGVIGFGGHKLEESQSMYQNSTSGQLKAAHQRILNDQGVRIINEKDLRTGDETEDTEYKGINENEAAQFHQQFNAVKGDYTRNLQIGANINNNVDPKALGMGGLHK